MGQLDVNTPQDNILYLSTALAVFDGNGSPEGVEDGALGSLYCNKLTGTWYQKTTALGTLTGWTLFSGGGGGAPSSPVNSFQFNNAGSFGGVDTITYDAPYLRIGNGAGSGAIKLYGNQAFHTFFALLAPPQDALENETYFWCDNPPTVTGEMFYALTKGANTTFGWTSNMTYNPVGRLSIDVTQNQSAFITVNNASSGNAAQARLAVTANVSGAALAVYSSTFTTSGLITANSVVLDMDGPTAMILAQSGGTFKIGLGTSTEHLRLTSTVLTLFGPNTGSVTGITVTSAAAGSGVTVGVTSSGSNENLQLIPKGTGLIQLWGTTANHPAFRRNGSLSTLILRNADDTANAIWIAGGFFTYNNALSQSGVSIIDAYGVSIGNGNQYLYSSAIDSASAKDLGTNRFAAGVLRVTNASTGAGQLLLGTSTDTADAQLSAYSQSTTRPALKLNMPSGTSATQETLGIYNNGTRTVYITAAGSLVLTNLGTAPSASVTDACLVYAADVTAGNANLFARNEAGQVSRLTDNTKVTNQDYTATNTTLATVTGGGANDSLTFNLEQNSNYQFRAALYINADATGGWKVTISGTAIPSNVRWHVLAFGVSAGLVNNTQWASLGSGSAATGNGVTAYKIEIEGAISVANAGAGNLTVEFAQNSASGTSTVLRGSSFTLLQGSV